jgi:hypothetical protein
MESKSRAISKKLLLPVKIFLMLILVQQNSCNAAETVGDATSTLPAVGQTEQYGVTSPFSKHQRLGNSSGIGGSYLGTESVTAETRAPVYSNIKGASAPEVHEPKVHLPTGIEMPSVSPGLSNFDIQTIGGKSTVISAARVILWDPLRNFKREDSYNVVPERH